MFCASITLSAIILCYRTRSISYCAVGHCCCGSRAAFARASGEIGLLCTKRQSRRPWTSHLTIHYTPSANSAEPSRRNVPALQSSSNAQKNRAPALSPLDSRFNKFSSPLFVIARYKCFRNPKKNSAPPISNDVCMEFSIPRAS